MIYKARSSLPTSPPRSLHRESRLSLVELRLEGGRTYSTSVSTSTSTSSSSSTSTSTGTFTSTRSIAALESRLSLVELRLGGMAHGTQ